jgi:hypothetical protein
MKIIQSYSQLNFDNPYVQKNLDERYIYLTFYSMLLSYLTVKQYYGPVTMYCNKSAYDSFLKYIPYENIVFMENKHDDINYWSVYKVDVINQMTEDFIHVDPDVMFFNDLMRPFIDGNYDAIVQDLIPAHPSFVRGFIDANKDYFPTGYDGQCYSCGVIGMKKHVIPHYKKRNTDIYERMLKDDFNILDKIGAMRAGVIEELGFYLTCFENSFTAYEILPFEMIKKENYDPRNVGNMVGYTHVWGGSKFMKEFIDLIKNKIYKSHYNYFPLVEKYEEEVIKKLKVRTL